MLIIRVQLWPGGRSRDAHEIGLLAAANVSDLADDSSYVATAIDDRQVRRTILVENHRRSDGFWPLVSRLCDSNAIRPSEPEHLAVVERLWQRMLG